ncbi:ABC transporter permease subunit [Escherichia coli]|nr:ABC transporter permease subunit [Escherichia coli]EFD1599921.1 ABC transporter permease subunit [Escherichia coli]EFD1616079.1 ABC transporter permease subunit [Escherichia coli]EFN7051664.1 ABC transporter permease subunit [Escherichia coli]
MLNYVIKRLLGLIPTLFIVSVLVFLFVHMLPGDPARLIAGPEADAQVIELVRQQLGLDQPLYHQFWHYISNAVQGDFGLSMVSRRPVADEIASRFMPTLWLTITSMVWAVIFGMAAGIIAAVWRNRWPDRLSMTILLRHILPGTVSSIVVFFTMRIGTSIISAASLSFLGLGAQPPTPEWGAMLNEARADMVIAPHVAVFPALAIFLTVLAFNLLGDGLRDALDPKIKG